MLNRTLQSAPLFLPAVAFIAGIATGRFLTGDVWWYLLIVAVVLMVTSWRWPLMQSAAVLATMGVLGAVLSSRTRLQHEQVTWPDDMVRYEAVIVSEPVEKPRTVAVDVCIVDNGRKVKCYIAKNGRSRALAVGDRLQLCSRIEQNRDWKRGAFDYRRYQEIQGFSGQTFVRKDDWQRLSRSWQGLSGFSQLKLRFLCYRHQLLERYRAMGAADEQYAVVAAMTLGDKSAMTHELKNVYAVSGASHVLALSGLHLGIIYMILSLLVVNRRLRFVSQILIVTAIWGFALLVGLPSSVIRSAVMISVYALLSLAGHNRMSLNALALAALCILTVSPDALFDIGFQMSFLAMLAILTVQPLLEGLIRRERLFDHPLLRWLWGLTTVSVAAQVGVAPLVACYFGRFSTYFLLTNLIVIPAVIVILDLALASLLLPVVGSVLLWVVGALNTVLSFVAARLPFASIEGLHPSVLQTAMIYVMIISVYLIVVRYDKSV